MDLVFRTRSLGAAAEGVRDQYADGKAAKVWQVLIGDKKERTKIYRDFLVGLLRAKGCKRILDVACGTGVDSMMLLEEGFEVVSIDASDKMLKHALKDRWLRRKEPAFDNWVIEEANWLTLTKDIEHLIGDGFDAVICLGNSFAHIPDSFGDQREQKQILRNFEQCIKPGGYLLIDHRNYDSILASGKAPLRCIYYNSKHTKDIRTSIYYVAGEPQMVILDYFISVDDNGCTDGDNDFRLSYYPHRLKSFRNMLSDTLSPENHIIYADFKSMDEIEDPAFYIHFVEKKVKV